MSRRHRRRAPGTTLAGPPTEIERLLEKGRIKEAFKLAKLRFRQQTSDENRRLLERTYLLRVQDLVRGGMPGGAVEVARSFLEFGVTDPDAMVELASLLAELGLVDEARKLTAKLGSPVAGAALAVSLADRAVLHPEQAGSDVRPGAELIRAALAAVVDEPRRSHELLQEIPRSSPWADWRYFVRGLVAFRAGEKQQARANWERLDRRRVAHRIASRLQGALGPPTATADTTSRKIDLSPLEAAAFGEPLLARLKRVQRLTDRASPGRSWTQALPLIASLRVALRRLEPRLAERLTDLLTMPLIGAAVEMTFGEAKRLISDFAQAAEPASFDPHWNRLWALCWEHTDGSRAVTFWKKYIADLDQLAHLTADERRRRQALVWRHIGMKLADEAREEMAPFDEKPARRILQLRDEAVEAAEESVRVDPMLRSAHELLISLFEEWDSPDRAADARRKLLESFPSDVETLKDLVAYSILRDEPEQALNYIRRARKLRPLDASLADNEHWQLISLARHFALDRRWNDARAVFAQAEVMRPADASDFFVLARRAVLELKAHDLPRAEELIALAKANAAAPAPLWLVLAAESARYKLGAQQRAEFNRQLNAALRKRKSGETAGELAHILGGYFSLSVDYQGRDQHLREVRKYLLATSRTRYSEGDLGKVCRFLYEFCDEPDFLQRLLRRGLRSFPKCPLFHLLRAEEELRRGPPLPFKIERAHAGLEKALALAEADAQGRYDELLDDIKRQLAMVKNLVEMRERMTDAAGGRFGLPNLFDMFSNLINVEDDEDDDDGPYGNDDDFVPPFFAAPPPRERQRKRRSR